MSRIETQSMPREKFLTIAVNLLHRAFMEARRDDAKILYRELIEGRRAPLTRVQMEDKSTVRFDLSMDYSQYEGSLNFGAFRASLTALLGNLADAIKSGREITTFGAQGDPDNIIFGVTGVNVDRGIPSVLVLSTHSDPREAAIQLRLMYLDYQQFLATQQDAAPDQA
ncbi:hypothetical protein DWB85_04415 [Seongchinamella sediminis]|uniref:Uncharacterized protein n=1 Tax=Seongchinamella sediminis TaxID=2283635 RepID=A0A3L7E143_9GAMM|nr:hypothetical protein [Seongchinamella sediminis]RLQ23214.1 hypothetical protein DWB85_04415 [Seongchinamella sediminis]